MFHSMRVRSFVTGVAAAFAMPACLTPPCQCGPGAAAVSTTPSANGARTAGSSDGVIWDGEENGAGAKGWQDCDKKPGCKATLAPEPGAGFNNTVGLKFHGEGPGWIGMGWNWLGWWPANGGTDITSYAKLSFRMRVEAKNADDAPDPGSIGVSLKCSSNPEKGQSNAASLVKYTKDNLLDGQWHTLDVPVADMKKAEFDPKTAWEFVLSTWSPTPRNFTIYLDDVHFQN